MDSTKKLRSANYLFLEQSYTLIRLCNITSVVVSINIYGCMTSMTLYCASRYSLLEDRISKKGLTGGLSTGFLHFAEEKKWSHWIFSWKINQIICLPLISILPAETEHKIPITSPKVILVAPYHQTWIFLCVFHSIASISNWLGLHTSLGQHQVWSERAIDLFSQVQVNTTERRNGFHLHRPILIFIGLVIKKLRDV